MSDAYDQLEVTSAAELRRWLKGHHNSSPGSMSPLGHRRFLHRFGPGLRWRKICACLGRNPLEA